jgi:hypothetical protein
MAVDSKSAGYTELGSLDRARACARAALRDITAATDGSVRGGEAGAALLCAAEHNLRLVVAELTGDFSHPSPRSLDGEETTPKSERR